MMDDSETAVAACTKPTDVPSVPPIVGRTFASTVLPELATQIVQASRPAHRDAHLVEGAQGAQLLLVNGSRLFHLPTELVPAFHQAIHSTDSHDQNALSQLIAQHGLQAQIFIDDQPLAAPPIHALSLAIAQKHSRPSGSTRICHPV